MTKPNLFESALAAEGITGTLAELARSIYAQESGGGRDTRTSNQGAVGGMQVLPGTFAEVADKGWSITNPEHNARAGIRYLKKMHDRAGGDPELAAIGYYGGPGGIAKAKQGVAVRDPKNPGAPSTLQYGRQVLARMGWGDKGAAPVLVQAPGSGQGEAVAVPPAMVVAQAPVEAPPAPVPGPAPTGPDPWQAFLQGMPRARPQIQAEDLDFGTPAPSTLMVVQGASMAPVAPMRRLPDFQAFGAWKGRAA
jgi:hypothetical protein